MFDTAIQYYLKKDASALTDREWCDSIAQLVFLRSEEKEASKFTP